MPPIIAINARILGGTPVFAGTRVPVDSSFDVFKQGRTLDYFLKQCPTVRREQVKQLLNDAKTDVFRRGV